MPDHEPCQINPDAWFDRDAVGPASIRVYGVRDLARIALSSDEPHQINSYAWESEGDNDGNNY